MTVGHMGVVMVTLPIFTKELLIVPSPKETAATALSHSVAWGLAVPC